MAFDKDAYLRFLVSSGVVGFFPEGRKLKSGRVSHWYANCRVLSDTAGSLEKLAGFVLDFVKGLNIEYDYFFGIPEGSTKLGIILNYLKAEQEDDPQHPIVMGRGKEKSHGDPRDRFVIGPLNEGDRIVAVEDVATTGGSMLETVNRLIESHVRVEALIVLVDRLEQTESGLSVEEKVNELELRYCQLSTAEDILPLCIRENPPPDELIAEIEEDFRTYGARELKLR
jgi:orotate phosphoribosyltransferase